MVILLCDTEYQVYIPPDEQDPQDLAWMREALVMVSEADAGGLSHTESETGRTSA